MTVIAAGWLGIVGLLTFVFPASNGYSGRVAYVTLSGGKNLSAELVNAGLAWPSWRHAGPLASSLAVLQMRAMSDRRGLWGEAFGAN